MFPDVEVEYIDLFTEEGQKMMQEHNILFLPGIFVNGEFISFGGLDRDKLVKKLRELTAKDDG